MFRADNFSVMVLILMAFTIMVIRVRMTKPLENTWPLVYWVLICSLPSCGRKRRSTWRSSWRGWLRISAALRVHEPVFIGLVRYVEYAVWTYVMLRGMSLCFY